MSEFRKIVKKNILKEYYDLSSFIKDDILLFIDKCKKGISLKENISDNEIDKEINNILHIFRENIKQYNLEVDYNNKYFYMIINGIKIIVYLDPNKTIEGGYDIESGDIYLFLTSMTDITKKEVEITLEHELQHYFDIKNTGKENIIPSINKTKEEYYKDDLEFRAHKRAFISAAKSILFQNDSNAETDIKKLPKKNIYELFNYIEKGKLPLYAEWFLSLTDEQKKTTIR